MRRTSPARSLLIEGQIDVEHCRCVVKQTVVFSQWPDDRGSSYRAIHLADDGSLVIEGQDMGSGVSDFFGAGFSEYEFYRTVRPTGVAQLGELVGIGRVNILDGLREHFGTTRALEQFLEENGIESEFWSRVGD
jgi:hypothetical protein